jgi:hypothetical protein
MQVGYTCWVEEALLATNVIFSWGTIGTLYYFNLRFWHQKNNLSSIK